MSIDLLSIEFGGQEAAKYDYDMCTYPNITFAAMSETYADMAKPVFSWLFEKPISYRLTKEEKEMIRKEYADTYPDDIDCGLSNIAIASVLKRIFGKDFFENNNYEEDNV